MPHLVILYTPNLDAISDISQLCRSLADTLILIKDEKGEQVYPTGGVRVLAYPAAHYAVADGAREYGFIYLNLRMGRGRSTQTHAAAGDVLTEAAQRHFDALLKEHPIGLTLQIDEGHEVFSAKKGSLHALFPRG